MAELTANSGDPDQTSDLGLNCLPVTRLGSLQWVKIDPFQRGVKTILTHLPPLKVYLFPLKLFV